MIAYAFLMTFLLGVTVGIFACAFICIKMEERKDREAAKALHPSNSQDDFSDHIIRSV